MNWKYIFFQILFIVLLKNSKCFTIMTEKLLKLDKFEGICDGYENLPMTLQNLTFGYNGRMMIINGKLVVRHDLNHQIEQVLALTRCRNREALDTCENYNNMKFSRCCDLLKVEGQLWSPFIESIHPRIRCPVKAGIYSLDNSTFDASFPLIPLDGWYWRVVVKSYDIKTKEQLLCMNVEAEIITVHKKNN